MGVRIGGRWDWFYSEVCLGRAVAMPGMIFGKFVLRMDGSDQFIQNIDSL